MSPKRTKQNLISHLYTIVAQFDPIRENEDRRIDIEKPGTAYMYEVNRFNRYLHGEKGDVEACRAFMVERLESEGWANCAAPWASRTERNYWKMPIDDREYFIEIAIEQGMSGRTSVRLNISHLG